jgi:hypothetical protein
MNKQQKGWHMKRQHTCAVALMLGCVFATPSNAKPDSESTIGPVTRFCGDRVCPAYWTTRPKVAEHRTIRRVARPVLPKPRPIEADDNTTATTSPQKAAKVITTSEARPVLPKPRPIEADDNTTATTSPQKAAKVITTSEARPVLPKPRPIEADDNATATTSPQNTAKVITTSEAVKTTPNANGNKVPGIVVSAKTGARASVGVAYAARFQAYIDDLENNHGARVLFMHGIRPGRCLLESQHPCGKALDLCQLGWGKVDARCNLPDRVTLGQIAAAHGLFEGGRWCHSDYGHAQTSVTAAACNEGPFRIVRRTRPEPIPDERHP